MAESVPVGLLKHVVTSLRGGAADVGRASGRTALESHLPDFAAERARQEGRVIDVAEFRREIAPAGARA